MTVDARAVARHPHSALLTRHQLALYLRLLALADDLGRLQPGEARAEAYSYAGDDGLKLLVDLVAAGFLDRYPPGGLVAILDTRVTS